MLVPWWWHPLVVVDVETTGFDVQRDAIVQLAVVNLDRGVETSARSWYLNPGRPVGSSVRVHGLTDEFLSDKPRIDVVREEVQDHLRAAIPVAYQARFDARFLRAGWDEVPNQCPALDPDWRWIDPLIWVRRRDARFGRNRSNTLEAAAARYDIPLTKAHDALADARATAGLLAVVKAEAPSDLESLLRAQSGCHRPRRRVE